MYSLAICTFCCNHFSMKETAGKDQGYMILILPKLSTLLKIFGISLYIKSSNRDQLSVQQYRGQHCKHTKMILLHQRKIYKKSVIKYTLSHKWHKQILQDLGRSSLKIDNKCPLQNIVHSCKFTTREQLKSRIILKNE